jgi:hypothetical protein
LIGLPSSTKQRDRHRVFVVPVFLFRRCLPRSTEPALNSDVATIRRSAMKRRSSRRTIPSVTYLESRRLLSETVVSIQQDNADYVGQTNADYLV